MTEKLPADQGVADILARVRAEREAKKGTIAREITPDDPQSMPSATAETDPVRYDPTFLPSDVPLTGPVAGKEVRYDPTFLPPNVPPTGSAAAAAKPKRKFFADVARERPQFSWEKLGGSEKEKNPAEVATLNPDQQPYVFHPGDEFAATSSDWKEKKVKPAEISPEKKQGIFKRGLKYTADQLNPIKAFKEIREKWRESGAQFNEELFEEKQIEMFFQDIPEAERENFGYSQLLQHARIIDQARGELFEKKNQKREQFAGIFSALGIKRDVVDDEDVKQLETNGSDQHKILLEMGMKAFADDPQKLEKFLSQFHQKDVVFREENLEAYFRAQNGKSGDRIVYGLDRIGRTFKEIGFLRKMAITSIGTGGVVIGGAVLGFGALGVSSMMLGSRIGISALGGLSLGIGKKLKYEGKRRAQEDLAKAENIKETLQVMEENVDKGIQKMHESISNGEFRASRTEQIFKDNQKAALWGAISAVLGRIGGEYLAHEGITFRNVLGKVGLDHVFEKFGAGLGSLKNSADHFLSGDQGVVQGLGGGAAATQAHEVLATHTPEIKSGGSLRNWAESTHAAGASHDQLQKPSSGVTGTLHQSMRPDGHLNSEISGGTQQPHFAEHSGARLSDQSGRHASAETLSSTGQTHQAEYTGENNAARVNTNLTEQSHTDKAGIHAENTPLTDVAHSQSGRPFDTASTSVDHPPVQSPLDKAGIHAENTPLTDVAHSQSGRPISVGAIENDGPHFAEQSHTDNMEDKISSGRAPDAPAQVAELGNREMGYSKVYEGGGIEKSAQDIIESNPKAFGLNPNDPKFHGKVGNKAHELAEGLRTKLGLKHKIFDRIASHNIQPGDEIRVYQDPTGKLNLTYNGAAFDKVLSPQNIHGAGISPHEVSHVSAAQDISSLEGGKIVPEHVNHGAGVAEHHSEPSRGRGKMKFSPEIEEMDRKAAASAARALESQQHADNLRAQAPEIKHSYDLAHVQQVQSTGSLLKRVFEGAGVSEYADILNKPIKEWSTLLGSEYHISQDVQFNDATNKVNINLSRLRELYPILKPYASQGSGTIGDCLSRAMKDPINVLKINKWVLTARR